MARVTSKLQLTLPKALAQEYKIQPGDHVEWTAAGEAIRLLPIRDVQPEKSLKQRLALFDEASRRQEHRNRALRSNRRKHRGWTREEIYTRGDSR